jgi:hypothetical protein
MIDTHKPFFFAFLLTKKQQNHNTTKKQYKTKNKTKKTSDWKKNCETF